MPRMRPNTAVYIVLAGAAFVLVGVLAIRTGGLGPQGGADAPSGRALMGDLGCLSCHSIAGQGGNLAPPLGSELAARGEAAIVDYLTSGRNVNVYPGNGHAAFTELDGEQARRIARYLASLAVSGAYRGPPGTSPP